MTPEERNWALTGYGLYLVAPFTTGLTTLIGVILAHIRKDGARGTIFESHYRNLILVFWVWFAVAAIAAVLVISGLASMLLPLITWRRLDPAHDQRDAGDDQPHLARGPALSYRGCRNDR